MAIYNKYFTGNKERDAGKLTNIVMHANALERKQLDTELLVREAEEVADPDAFIMTVSMSAAETMVIPATDTSSDFNYIDWGDGTVEFDIIGASPSHEYADAGEYQIKLNGYMPSFGFANEGNKLNLIGIDQFGNTSLTNVVGFAYGCSNCTYIKTSDFDCKGITSLVNFATYCSSLTDFEVGHWDVSKVTSFTNFIFYTTSLLYLDVSSWNTSSATSMYQFAYSSGVPILDVGAWDVSNVTNFGRFVYDCSNLSALPVDNWNVSSVTSFSQFATYCVSLSSLDLSNWDVSSVVDFNNFLTGATGLVSLNCSGWNLSSCTSMGQFAFACSSLVDFDVTNWSFGTSISLTTLAFNCPITTIAINTWSGTSYVTNMSSMFGGTDLPTIDLSNFDTSNVTTLFQFAYNTPLLTDILGLETRNVSACTNFNSFITSGKITTPRYDAVLNQSTGWPSQVLQNGAGADMYFGNSQYSLSDTNAVAGRDILINTYNWNVIDGGGI